MRKHTFTAVSVAALAVTSALAGCASDGGILTTASVQPQAAKVAKADPACVALAQQIEKVRSEGTVGRVEKAAEGSTRSVTIKRAALSKVAELNKLNAEYRAKCSNPLLKAQKAKPAGAQATANAAAALAKKAAADAAAKQAQSKVEGQAKKVVAAAQTAAAQ